MSERARPTVQLEAACACGAVTVRVSGPIRSMFFCSCEDCQKASGTGHSAVAIARRDDVAVAGATRTYSRAAASGATFTRTFCPTCATPIHGETSRWDGVVMLPVGLFGRETGWFEPNQLIFARSHCEWDTLDADLPRHETYRLQKEEH